LPSHLSSGKQTKARPLLLLALLRNKRWCIESRRAKGVREAIEKIEKRKGETAMRGGKDKAVDGNGAQIQITQFKIVLFCVIWPVTFATL